MVANNLRLPQAGERPNGRRRLCREPSGRRPCWRLRFNQNGFTITMMTMTIISRVGASFQ